MKWFKVNFKITRTTLIYVDVVSLLITVHIYFINFLLNLPVWRDRSYSFTCVSSFIRPYVRSFVRSFSYCGKFIFAQIWTKRTQNSVIYNFFWKFCYLLKTMQTEVSFDPWLSIANPMPWKIFVLEFSSWYPVGIYMFKVNNRNTRTKCEICSKLSR